MSVHVISYTKRVIALAILRTAISITENLVGFLKGELTLRPS